MIPMRQRSPAYTSMIFLALYTILLYRFTEARWLQILLFVPLILVVGWWMLLESFDD